MSSQIVHTTKHCLYIAVAALSAIGEVRKESMLMVNDSAGL